MQMRRSKPRRRRRHIETAMASTKSSSELTSPALAQRMPTYARGMIVSLMSDAAQDHGGEEKTDQVQMQEEKGEREEEESPGSPVEPLPDVSGSGEPASAVAYQLTLRGRTTASYSSSFSTSDVTVTRAQGCQGCPSRKCVRARGTLVSTFTVTTTVTLPNVSDFPNLTQCQQQRVQDAITNQLAPHEQEHVVRFNQYNGTVRTPFDMTLCRDTFNGRVQALHDSIDSARQAAANAASASLDPFEINVDLNCQDPRDTGAPPDAGQPHHDAGSQG